MFVKLNQHLKPEHYKLNKGRIYAGLLKSFKLGVPNELSSVYCSLFHSNSY